MHGNCHMWITYVERWLPVYKHVDWNFNMWGKKNMTHYILAFFPPTYCSVLFCFLFHCFCEGREDVLSPLFRGGGYWGQIQLLRAKARVHPEWVTSSSPTYCMTENFHLWIMSNNIVSCVISFVFLMWIEFHMSNLLLHMWIPHF